MLPGVPLSSRRVMAERLRSHQTGKVGQSLRGPFGHTMDKWDCLNLKICSRALMNGALKC